MRKYGIIYQIRFLSHELGVNRKDDQHQKLAVQAFLNSTQCQLAKSNCSLKRKHS